MRKLVKTKRRQYIQKKVLEEIVKEQVDGDTDKSDEEPKMKSGKQEEVVTKVVQEILKNRREVVTKVVQEDLVVQEALVVVHEIPEEVVWKKIPVMMKTAVMMKKLMEKLPPPQEQSRHHGVWPLLPI